MGCSPRAVQFSSLVWPFLAMVVFGWLVIMAGTEQKYRHMSVMSVMSVWRIVLCGIMRQGNGDVVLETRIYYRCIDISISAHHSPFSFHASSPTGPLTVPPSSLPASASCPDSFRAPFLRHRLLIERGSCGFVFITNSADLTPTKHWGAHRLVAGTHQSIAKIQPVRNKQDGGKV